MGAQGPLQMVGLSLLADICIDVALGDRGTEIRAPGKQWGDKVLEDLALNGKHGCSLDF